MSADTEFLKELDQLKAIYFLPWVIRYMGELSQEEAENLSVFDLVQIYNDHQQSQQRLANCFESSKT